MELLKINKEKLLLHFNFFDENYDLITPVSRKRYQLGLHDHLLDENEVIENLKNQNDSQWFRKAENNFLSFFEELLEFETFVEFSDYPISNTEFAINLNYLDYENKEDYITFIQNYKSEELNVFKINKISEIRLCTKFLTREIFKPTFHFENGKVNILSNYDFFYPIFFESENLLDKYSAIAKKHNLYILEV